MEDRERRKQDERERKLKEEKLEELRIQKQQQEDRLRYEEEKRKIEERQLIEQRKLETLKKALEEAEQKAKQEKEKRFIKQKQNISRDIILNEKPLSARSNSSNTYNTNSQKEKCDNLSIVQNDNTSHRTYDSNSTKNQIIQCHSSIQGSQCNTPRSISTGNLNLFVQNVPSLSLTENQYSVVPIGISEDTMNNQQQGLQLAVLVPQNLSNSLYHMSLNSLNLCETIDSSLKVLTPRKFRSFKYKDVSTQTDTSFLKFAADKDNDDDGRTYIKDYQNIDENAPQESNHNTLKKDRRLRLEERYKKDLETRPKWGVNRPAAQYKKQSEKDPFYSQKRKMRQKYRSQYRQYISQSSDDSRSPSPPIRSDKLHISERNSVSQSYWRSKRSGQDLLKNKSTNSDVADDTRPFYNQFGQITINDTIDHKRMPINSNLSPAKRMTLSQKFINDKYGNRKLWNDDVVKNKNNKSHSLDVENRKKIIDQLNMSKKDYLEKFENECNNVIQS